MHINYLLGNHCFGRRSALTSREYSAQFSAKLTEDRSDHCPSTSPELSQDEVFYENYQSCLGEQRASFDFGQPAKPVSKRDKEEVIAKSLLFKRHFEGVNSRTGPSSSKVRNALQETIAIVTVHIQLDCELGVPGWNDLVYFRSLKPNRHVRYHLSVGFDRDTLE